MINIIKLTSGDSIIGELVNEDSSHVSVIDPLQLEIGEGDTGNPVMMALLWVPLAKPTNLINIKTPQVICVAECDEETTKYYYKSLAVLKGDEEKLREILNADKAEDIFDDMDDNVVTFPTKVSANTVH